MRIRRESAGLVVRRQVHGKGGARLGRRGEGDAPAKIGLRQQLDAVATHPSPVAVLGAEGAKERWNTSARTASGIADLLCTAKTGCRLLVEVTLTVCPDLDFEIAALGLGEIALRLDLFDDLVGT